MRSKLVVGNWKMNGSRAANAELLSGIVAGLDGAEAACAVCVPCVYLHQTQELLAGSRLAVGAQDVSAQQCGAFTGEVATSMLTEFGCQYVIVGHSERRAYHLETSELVACKAEAVLRAGMTPIVCVGETLGERDAGMTNAVVGEQLAAVLKLLTTPDIQNIRCPCCMAAA
jgi:triosephosphate isomerase